MKVSELTGTSPYTTAGELRQAMGRDGQNLSVDISSCIKGVTYSLKISDWRTKRKWRLLIDGNLGELTYGSKKRLVVSSDDLGVIADALYEDAANLSAAYDKRTLKQSATSGDLRPWVIDELRKKLEPKIKVRSTSGMAALTITGGQTHVYVGFTDTTLNLTVSSPVGSTVIKIDMANPSFYPSELGDNILKCLSETKKLIKSSKNHFKSIWKTTNG